MTLEKVRAEWTETPVNAPVLDIRDDGQLIGEVYALPTSAGTCFVTLAHDWAGEDGGPYRPVRLIDTKSMDHAIGLIVDYARGAHLRSPSAGEIKRRLVANASRLGPS